MTKDGFYEAIDFAWIGNDVSPDQAAEKINTLRREYLAQLPVVYSGAVESEEWDARRHPMDTHKARLDGLEELK